MKNNRITWGQYQEDIFSELVVMVHSIRSLGSYVQNDFSTMLSDGTVTKSSIKSMIFEANDEFDESIEKLKQLKLDVQ